jgi:sugar phosphate isomerase/epimerase
MNIGIVTDEISPDMSEAIRYGTSWGIRHYELRMVGTNRVPNLPEKDVEEILRLKKEHNLIFTAISPGLFKISLNDEEALSREVEQTLPATFQFAERIGTNKIIVFGFKRYENEPQTNISRVVEILKRVAVEAERRGFIIAIENEPGFWCNSGSNTAKILQMVNSHALGANWDPANAMGTDEAPYPDGYNAIKPFIKNLHVKDTAKGALVECVPVGDGVIDWNGQLRAVVQDGMLSHVTIETHCLPLVEQSKKNVDRVHAMLDAIKRGT